MLAHTATTLANGLPVVHVPLAHAHTVGVCLAVGCGSRHDPAGLLGLGHLLEHMLFRGSARHPTLEGLAQAIEAAGASLDAGTWRDQMELTLQVLPDGLAAALCILADVVASPTLGGLDAERGVVLEEMHGELDAAGDTTCLGSRCRRRIWRGHPLAHPIVGDEASLSRMTVDALRGHHRRLFVARNMALCVSGPVTSAELAHALAPLAALPAGRPAAQGSAPAPWRDGVEVVRKPGTQAAVLLTFAAPADVGHQLAPARLVAALLDGGMATRLQAEVVNRRGWAYDLDSGLDCYRDVGAFDIEVHCAPHRAADTAQVILEAVQGLARQAPSGSEVDAAARRLTFAATCELDDITAICGRYASHALFGHPLDWRSELAELSRVDAAAITRQARAMFVDGPLQITVVGPVSERERGRIAALMSAGRSTAA